MKKKLYSLKKSSLIAVKFLYLQIIFNPRQMYAFISGKIAEITPAYAVVDNHGVGYFINITLNTFAAIGEQTEVKLYTHLQVLEDAHNLFGFYTAKERDMFELLISVSGVGCNTARLILSSLTVDELSTAIASEDIRTIQAVKGIGSKTAQRLVVDLKDKVKKTDFTETFAGPANNTVKNEALSALVILGFSKNAASKALDKLLKQSPDSSVEVLIREALKLL